MIEFTDILYGTVSLPDWIVPFLRIPEFVRLRGVGLSNVDSFQFKDFGGAARWEHCIAVAALALRCAEKRNLSEKDRAHLSLAALFHDIATPPYAHTMEHVLEGFDHELESQRMLRAIHLGDADPAFPVFASELPQFQKLCAAFAKQHQLPIDPDEIAKMVVGDGDLGFLINGTIDLDNADNVTRASLYLGIDVDRNVPLGVADWLAVQETVPLDLDKTDNEAVVKWMQYRRRLYHAFYVSSDEEHGRQAFLQHLCRTAVVAGVPRSQMVWNTDDGLLTLLSGFQDSLDEEGATSLKELVRRYRLLEPPVLLSAVSIDDDESLRILSNASAVSWIERQLKGHFFNPFVFVSERRYSTQEDERTLFSPASGVMSVFKLGQSIKANQLPAWLRVNAPEHLTLESLRRILSQALQKHLPSWIKEKPWSAPTKVRQRNVLVNLDAVGNWSFRLSRNETLHSYPSTFVHAIPACLINALGLRGDLVVDTFGGTGQTAMEAIRSGGRAVSGDVNSIAVLVARSKFTYLSLEQRLRLKTVNSDELFAQDPAPAPQFELVEKWHHPDTLMELRRLLSFINAADDPVLGQFMRVAFSAILTSTTGRKGKEHGFFADNTPLPKGTELPPYEKAIETFVAKVRRNLEIIERFYASIERSGRSVEAELRRANIVRLDATRATAAEYGVEKHSVGAVITSPPYLCMSDYSLGQRLSYQWLFPEQLSADHAVEVGARRRRFQAPRALEAYLNDFRAFTTLASALVRHGGFCAVVLGAPEARPFKEANLLQEVDGIFDESGFSFVWSTWRSINWHRNHGYSRLQKERIAVYVRNS